MKLRKLLVGVISCMLLSSCASSSENNEDSSYSYEEEREILKDALETVPIEKGNALIDLTPLELVDEIDDPSTESLVKFKAGDPNQIVKVVSSDYRKEGEMSTYLYSYTPKLEDVSLKDENDNPVNFSLSDSSDGVSQYLVPVSTFSENHFYHLKLANSKVKFLGKDASVRELTYYSLDVNDSNRVHTVNRRNEDVKSFDIKNVQYFDVDAYGAYLIYIGEFDIDPSKADDTGMMFRISDLSLEGDNEETTYGRLVSINKNPNGAGLFVRYEPCNGKDLYDGLNINDNIKITDETASNIGFCKLKGGR